MRQFKLGNPGPLRDKLVQAVLDGRKTATSSLLSEWTAESEGLPMVGEKQILIDSLNRKVAIIEITGVSQCRLAEIGESAAIDEGEGFKNVTDWREAHEDFWKPTTVDDNTLIVVEYFKVVDLNKTSD